MTTLKDVARHSGCDVSTVSRVLNNRPCRVGEEVRGRIHDTALRLGYVPTRTASSLVSGRTRTIGLLVPNVFDGVFAEYIEALDFELTGQGYALRPFICHNRPEKEDAALDSLLHNEIDAMIAMFYNDADIARYEQIRRHGKPLIFRCPEAKMLETFDTVQLDLSEGYRRLAGHLIDCGCHRIGLVGGGVAQSLSRNETDASVEQFRCAFRDGGLPPPDARNAVVCADSQEAAHAALLDRLRREPSCFDGVIVHNINKVFGATRAIRDAGLAIPREMKVATISDLSLCRMAPEPLTVWAQPIPEICHALVELTLERLRGPDAPCRHITIHSELRIRESTQPTSGKSI